MITLGNSIRVKSEKYKSIAFWLKRSNALFFDRRQTFPMKFLTNQNTAPWAWDLDQLVYNTVVWNTFETVNDFAVWA